MAIKANLFVLALSLLIIGIFSSSASIALQTSRPTSSKWTPRFLGGHSKPLIQNRQQQPQYQYETRYFSQPLDHFSFSDLPSFPQRYLISTEHWVGAQRLGPIFFYCGNEGDIEWFAANTGFVWEIAPRFGAMVVFPEVMLAAWMRLKYPHVAVGALASSAPILQFEDIVPPETFYDIVSGAFKRESTSCFNTIKESWDVLISESLKNDGLLQLTKTFHLCRTLKRTEDLRDWLDSAYSYLAMVNYPYSSDFLMPLPGHPIREVCRKIDGCPHGTSILERIFEGVSVYYNYTGGVDCFQLDDDPHGMDGWNWQACTEMVMPMSSSRDASMYPTYDYNHSSFQEECWKEFKVKPRPRWITTEFGGHDVKTALKKFGSNIIFSNGLLDPWSGGSVLQNVSETIVALVTEEGAHHIDLRASSSEDPDWLLEQRATEIKLIKGWISDYYEEKKAIIDM
ncbi:hypothetical protein F2P56_023961 [Juglans regia]|uniref:Lysosomal Pro-X carboxypeptidase-like n=1 Tax=Juglans regia TaxID=51240 RepID=A0A833X097_JUGRE|nr:hypothetical protein F2P56_023961 [Juglans regia]